MPGPHSTTLRRRPPAGVRAAVVAAALGGLAAPASAAAQLPTWIFDSAARPALTGLWRESVAARAERVACLAGTIGPDTVWITGAKPVPGKADSLGADPEPSLAACRAPEWIGTVHTHIRSTDDPHGVGRFSPGDRAMMSEWAIRWGRKGAFCVLYTATGAHCELYPPGKPGRVIPAPE
jgi:hypothetical protein